MKVIPICTPEIEELFDQRLTQLVDEGFTRERAVSLALFEFHAKKLELNIRFEGTRAEFKVFTRGIGQSRFRIKKVWTFTD